MIKKVLRNGFSLLVKVSPELSSKVVYYKTFGKKLDLKNPITFNEKLMWLKLNEEDSLKSRYTDKYLVRDYIEDLGYSNILNELYKVFDSVEDIDFDELPNRFVIKCTHGSGFNIICPNKDKLNKEETLKQLAKWMKTDYSLFVPNHIIPKLNQGLLLKSF